MGSIADPGGEFGEWTQPPPPSFDEFQRQTSLMTSCTLLWKELSDHFSSLEQNLLKQPRTPFKSSRTARSQSPIPSPPPSTRSSSARRPLSTPSATAVEKAKLMTARVCC
ncbi:hypothetical protein CsSME_00033477 [Camellia sinensis var. sinensis]